MRTTRRVRLALVATAVSAVIVAGCSDETGENQSPDSPNGEIDPVDEGGEPTDDTGPGDPTEASTGDVDVEDLPPQTVELTGPAGADGIPAGVTVEIPGSWTVADLGQATPGSPPPDDQADDAADGGVDGGVDRDDPADIGDDGSESGSDSDASAGASDLGAQPTGAPSPTDTGPAPEGGDEPSGELAEQTGIAPNLWCLIPPEEFPELGGCAGLSVAVGGDWLPGEYGTRYTPHQEAGWRPHGDPLVCPLDPEASLEDGEDANLVEPVPGEAAPLSSVNTEVGSHSMRYEIWRVVCTETEEFFTPQMWHSPELDVLVHDYVGIPQTTAILGSMEPIEAVDDEPAGTDGHDGETATDSPAPETGDAGEATGSPDDDAADQGTGGDEE